MRSVVLKALVIIGNAILKTGTAIGIIGAIITVSSLQELEKLERQKR